MFEWIINSKICCVLRMHAFYTLVFAVFQISVYDVCLIHNKNVRLTLQKLWSCNVLRIKVDFNCIVLLQQNNSNIKSTFETDFSLKFELPVVQWRCWPFEPCQCVHKTINPGSLRPKIPHPATVGNQGLRLYGHPARAASPVQGLLNQSKCREFLSTLLKCALNLPF